MSLAASAGRGPGALWSPTHVQVTVLQARGLRAKGPGGTSDAYAVIQVGKEKYATSVSERSLGAPVWREEATFELPPLLSAGAAPAAAATLQLTVLHRALLGLDKFLGRAEVDLQELHRDQGRRKTQWYKLKSKPGKKDKERGEIEVDIQFMRNNMTASMFDLSMKDKSRSPFGKLKDKIKGKNKDNVSDSASAIVPSMTPTGDSDDELPTKDKKKKSKLKTLFSKSNLQKTPLSQSMSVLPTSKSDKALLRPGDFPSRWDDDDNEDDSSSTSDVLTHKRTASADPKQLNQVNVSLSKKDGLSFLGGLRSKNDTLSRSNVCINGNHVYLEQPESKSETKDSTPSSSPSPQDLRRKHLFSSTENLASHPWKEPGETGGVASNKQLSESSTKDSLKSMSLPSYRPLVSGDTRGNAAPENLETVKETKENKKQENRKSSLLSLVTGKKDLAKGGEGESAPTIVGKEKESTPPEIKPGEEPVKDLRKSEKDAPAVLSEWGRSLNPFEEIQVTEPEAEPESKSEPKPPIPPVLAPQTKAVKPRLEVSPEVQPKARLPSSPDSSLFFSALSSGFSQTRFPSELEQNSETQSSESPSAFSPFSSPAVAPVSTSTPIESWPYPDKRQASSEEPSLYLKGEFQTESGTQVPNTVSPALTSLSEQPPSPLCERTGDSPVGEPSEVDTEKNVRDERPQNSVLEGHEEKQQEDALWGFSPEKEDCIPSSEEAQEETFALSVRSGRIRGAAGKPWMGGNTDYETRSASLMDSKVRGSETASPIEGVAPLPRVGESHHTPHDPVTQTREERELTSKGQNKVKKRVSFSDQLFTEEEVEKPVECGEEDRSHPQERSQQGAATGGVCDTEDTEGKGVAEAELLAWGTPAPTVEHEQSFSKGPMRKTSSEKDSPLIRAEGDETLMEQCQSKASDHEGLLSDPLRALQSAADVKSPVMADLDLTLPSIPEVASDDERLDQVENVRETAKVATLEVEASSLSTSPPCPEEEKELRSVGGGPAVPAESPSDLSAKAPTAPVTASSEQATAFGIHKPHLGKSSSLDKQLPGAGSDEGEKVEGNGRPGQPLGTSLGSPVSSPSLSEPFPATHPLPCSPHSNTNHTGTAESQKKATAEVSAAKAEHSGKRKPLLQAWVSPSETHPVSAQHRLHPVKPMNTTATKVANSSLGTATIISENLINEAMMKKYNPMDPAFAYAQLTHDELIQLVLKQKETISKKEFQVRELEDYIDNLLVRVMEETPNILRIPVQVGKKAGKM